MPVDAQTGLDRALAAIDALHHQDPHSDGGRPAELVYAERMTARLNRLEPEPSEALRLAVRAQHLCRWRIPRADFAMDRAGYKAWRRAEAALHAKLAAECLRGAGCDEELVARVQGLVRKKKLKVDAETQLLEDVACLVFLEHHFDAFATAHGEDKTIDVLRKTWSKMSPRGHEAALGLDLPAHLASLVERALVPML